MVEGVYVLPGRHHSTGSVARCESDDDVQDMVPQYAKVNKCARKRSGPSVVAHKSILDALKQSSRPQPLGTNIGTSRDDGAGPVVGVYSTPIRRHTPQADGEHDDDDDSYGHLHPDFARDNDTADETYHHVYDCLAQDVATSVKADRPASHLPATPTNSPPNRRRRSPADPLPPAPHRRPRAAAPSTSPDARARSHANTESIASARSRAQHHHRYRPPTPDVCDIDDNGAELCRDLHEQSYFHGPISRDEAEKRLCKTALHHNAHSVDWDGMFLVREKEVGNAYVISVARRTADSQVVQCEHHLVEKASGARVGAMINSTVHFLGLRSIVNIVKALGSVHTVSNAVTHREALLCRTPCARASFCVRKGRAPAATESDL